MRRMFKFYSRFPCGGWKVWADEGTFTAADRMWGDALPEITGACDTHPPRFEGDEKYDVCKIVAQLTMSKQK